MYRLKNLILKTVPFYGSGACNLALPFLVKYDGLNPLQDTFDPTDPFQLPDIPMPCFLALIALITPRLVIVGLWLLTDWFVGVFETLLWPVLGFIFLPTTLLWYSVVHNWYGGEWGMLQIVVLIITVIIDLSPTSGKKRQRGG